MTGPCSGGRTRRALLGAVLCAVAVSAPWAEEARPVAASEIEARAFKVHHKQLQDVVLLVQPLLSADGSLLIEPRLSTLTVRDHRAVLEAVADLVAAVDVPPRNVRIEVRLISASQQDDGDSEAEAPDVRGIVQQLRGFVRWSDYRVLASMEVWTSEGESATLTLGDRFRLSLTVDRIVDRQQVVRVERFLLERIVREEDGETVVTPLWDTVVNLRNGQQTIFGATRTESDRKALFLSIAVHIED